MAALTASGPTRRLLAAVDPGQVRIALVEDDRLLDYALWRPGMPDGLGDLHRGRVERVLPALGGAFVALVSGSGFLPLSESGQNPVGGDAVAVRIVRAPQGGKGPRLRLERPATPIEPGPPCLLSRGPDPLSRLATAHPDLPIVADDAVLGAELVPLLRPRLSLAMTVLSDAVESQIAALSDPEVALPGGMRASLHPTPALVAIDLDGGASSGGRQQKATAQFAANRQAIPPLLHQLRLRNLSGAILLDLAGLPSRKRAALRPEIEQALSRDPLQPRLLGFTALGLAEILRPRLGPPLHELLSGPHAAGLAGLRALARFAASPPHAQPGLVAGLAVSAALDADAFARQHLARRTGHRLRLRTDPSLPADAWSLDHG